MTLFDACIEGDLERIHDVIDKGADDWNWGLHGACNGGHLEIVNLMIARGATDWVWGLRYACEGGHLEIVNLMIDKGATDLSYKYLQNKETQLYLLYNGHRRQRLQSIPNIGTLYTELDNWNEHVTKWLVFVTIKDLAGVIAGYVCV